MNDVRSNNLNKKYQSSTSFRPNSQSLRYERSTTLESKDITLNKLELGTNVQDARYLLLLRASDGLRDCKSLFVLSNYQPINREKEGLENQAKQKNT